MACLSACLFVYLVACWIGLQMPRMAPHVPAWWPAAGLALVGILEAGAPAALAVAVGSLAMALWQGLPWPLALALSAGFAGGPAIAAAWLRRQRVDARLNSWRDAGLMLGAGVVGGTLLSTANGAIWLAVAGRLTPLDMPRTGLLWWLSHALGVLLVGLPLLVARTRWRPPRPAQASDAAGERARLPSAWAVAQVIGAAVACALAVLVAVRLPADSAALAMSVLVLPPVLLTAWAHRQGLATAGGLAGLLALALMACTAIGLGPFAAPAGGAPMATAGLLALSGYLLLLGLLVLLAHVQAADSARVASRWQQALAGFDLGVAEWNLRTGQASLSATWRHLMQGPLTDVGTTLDRWLAQLHPDDRAALLADLQARSAGAASAPRREVRIHHDKGWRWLSVHMAVVERDDKGLATRVQATAAEAGALRTARERESLSNSVFMRLHEGLLITDADFRVLDANPTYCRITGIPREELLGNVPALLMPGTGELSVRQQQAGLWSALRHQGSWAGEVLERRRNGQACALHVTVSSVHGPDGALRYHVLVVSDVTEQRLQREQLERQAHFDELTRLPNRARLSQMLVEAMATTDREGGLLAVCYLDIDHFKAINDRHGHDTGDLLLAELAHRLRSTLRARSPAWTDAAARLGGDEFVLLLRASSVEEARGAVARVMRVVGQPFTLRLEQPAEVVTASIGATIYPLDASDADTLLRHADQAMYGAKQGGRNGMLFFDPELSRRTEERVAAVSRVQDALEQGQLQLYYQPKVDLRRGVVLGVEALLRWNHPERGLVPPAQFLPLIEHTGLSARLGDHVLMQALEQLALWRADGLDLSVSVNITGRHLQEPGFAQRLAELLARHAQPLGPHLELEVLETAALADIGLTSSLLERCARLGVRWALDDFGTGYSTLTYLKRLPVNVLKIDRSFVHNMLSDAQDRAIVDGVINLAGTFGCTVVAEGVETAAQARMLLDMGCEIGQGLGIAPPMPADALAAWAREWKGLFALSAASPAAPLPGAVPPADAGGLRGLLAD